MVHPPGSRFIRREVEGSKPPANYVFAAISSIRLAVVVAVAVADRAVARRCSNARMYRATSSLPYR